MEYLIKLKLFSLAAHVIYHNDVYSYTHGEEHIDYNGKKFQSILKVGLEYLPLLQKTQCLVYAAWPHTGYASLRLAA